MTKTHIQVQFGTACAPYPLHATCHEAVKKASVPNHPPVAPLIVLQLVGMQVLWHEREHIVASWKALC